MMTHYLFISNNLSSKYMKQILMELQRKIEKSTIIVRYFNISLSVIVR